MENHGIPEHSAWERNQAVGPFVWLAYFVVGFIFVGEGMTGSWNRERPEPHEIRAGRSSTLEDAFPPAAVGDACNRGDDRDPSSLGPLVPWSLGSPVLAQQWMLPGNLPSNRFTRQLNHRGTEATEERTGPGSVLPRSPDPSVPSVSRWLAFFCGKGGCLFHPTPPASGLLKVELQTRRPQGLAFESRLSAPR